MRRQISTSDTQRQGEAKKGPKGLRGCGELCRATATPAQDRAFATGAPVPPGKNSVDIVLVWDQVSDIKLIRTDNYT